jgi:hypothetical protein
MGRLFDFEPSELMIEEDFRLDFLSLQEIMSSVIAGGSIIEGFQEQYLTISGEV